MSYRDGPCTFCDQQGNATCPRCQDWVCAPHGVMEQGHCAMCAKELKDDLDERKFARAVNHPAEDRGLFSGQGRISGAPLEAVHQLGDAIGGWFDEHGAKKAFDARTIEDIAAWRQRAGVHFRAR